MNLHQLEYAVVLSETGHFGRAAEKCFVSQPTLSMMIQRLEAELGLTLFDRSSQPVRPTPEGVEIIRRAKAVLAEAQNLRFCASDLKNEVAGDLRLGIIPTLAPYLVPLFVRPLVAAHPRLHVHVMELVTDDILHQLKEDRLDVGIAATPLNDADVNERPLFREKFLAYVSPSEPIANKRFILPKDIDLSRLWLLQEDHCLRHQVLNLCELKKKRAAWDRMTYEAGSIEALIHLVDRNEGVTIVPELATFNMTAEQRRRLHDFADPKPVRQVSLLTARHFGRKKTLDALQSEIMKILPWKENQRGKIVKIKRR